MLCAPQHARRARDPGQGRGPPRTTQRAKTAVTAVRTGRTLAGLNATRGFLSILGTETPDSSRRDCGLARMCPTRFGDLAGGHVDRGDRALGDDRARNVSRHDDSPCLLAARATAHQCRAPVRLGEGVGVRRVSGGLPSWLRSAAGGRRMRTTPISGAARLEAAGAVAPKERTFGAPGTLVVRDVAFLAQKFPALSEPRHSHATDKEPA